MRSEFSTSIDDRYFEDYIVGNVHEFGAIAVTEEDIVTFARSTIHSRFIRTRQRLHSSAV